MTEGIPEADARRISTQVVGCLRALGAHVTEFGMHWDDAGFYFLADINGRRVCCRTYDGTLNYHGVAADMLARALSPIDTTPLFPVFPDGAFQ